MDSFETRSFFISCQGKLDAKRSFYFLDERFLVVRFLVDPFFVPPFLELRFFDPFFDPFFDGTLPPASRASDRPMAIACFLLVTFLPEPLFNVPRLRSRIAFSTFSPAFFPYLAIRVTSQDRFNQRVSAVVPLDHP